MFINSNLKNSLYANKYAEISIEINNGKVSENDTIGFTFTDTGLGLTHNINVANYLPEGFIVSNTVMLSGSVCYSASFQQMPLTLQNISMFRNGTIGISHSKVATDNFFSATILLMRTDV